MTVYDALVINRFQTVWNPTLQFENVCKISFILFTPQRILFLIQYAVLVIIINALWPRDAIWRHRSGSTLAQVMACCLTALSHYLNQCWLIISEVLCNSYDDRPANHYAFCVITTHFECQIRHYASLSNMWENYAFCEISAPSAPGIRPIPRNLQQLSRLVVSRKSPAVQNIDKGQLRTCLFYDYHRHRRQISPSDQQRKLQRWNHAQWNVEPIVNRSNAGGSSPTWSPASPV